MVAARQFLHSAYNKDTVTVLEMMLISFCSITYLLVIYYKYCDKETIHCVL